jgi:hypothetical protein
MASSLTGVCISRFWSNSSHYHEFGLDVATGKGYFLAQRGGTSQLGVGVLWLSQRAEEYVLVWNETGQDQAIPLPEGLDVASDFEYFFLNGQFSYEADIRPETEIRPHFYWNGSLQVMHVASADSSRWYFQKATQTPFGSLSTLESFNLAGSDWHFAVDVVKWLQGGGHPATGCSPFP